MNLQKLKKQIFYIQKEIKILRNPRNWIIYYNSITSDFILIPDNDNEEQDISVRNYLRLKNISKETCFEICKMFNSNKEYWREHMHLFKITDYPELLI